MSMFRRVDHRRPYQVPARKYQGDAGYDLHSPVQTVVRRGTALFLPLNVAVDLPPGWFALIQERSSHGKLGISTLGNVVDEGYEGEVGVTLHAGSADMHVCVGDRIAQLVLLPRFVDPHEHLLPVRGSNGFGSSGR